MNLITAPPSTVNICKHIKKHWATLCQTGWGGALCHTHPSRQLLPRTQHTHTHTNTYKSNNDTAQLFSVYLNRLRRSKRKQKCPIRRLPVPAAIQILTYRTMWTKVIPSLSQRKNAEEYRKRSIRLIKTNSKRGWVVFFVAQFVWTFPRPLFTR